MLIKYTYDQILENQTLLSELPSRFSLSCDTCCREFELTKSEVKTKIRKNCKKNYCSVKCFNDATDSQGSKEVECLSCKISFSKRWCEIKKSENHFCSRSCAAKFNNLGKTRNPRVDRICLKCGTLFHKMKTKKEGSISTELCSDCSAIMNSYRYGEHTSCLSCEEIFEKTVYNKIYCSDKCQRKTTMKNFRIARKKPCPHCDYPIEPDSKSCKKCRSANGEAIKLMTLGEFQTRLSVQGKHISWKNSHIRLQCRTWNRNLAHLPCQNCSYDKHIEFCHIKPVSTYPSTALVGVTNAPENILILCRNCHWEFDHGVLPLTDIKSR